MVVRYHPLKTPAFSPIISDYSDFLDMFCLKDLSWWLKTGVKYITLLIYPAIELYARIKQIIPDWLG